MNRLSNIFLAKENKNLEKKENEFNTKTNNRNNSYNSNTRKSFNRQTLARSPENASNRRASRHSPDHKFLYESLAMKSSKRPSTEDRLISRWMRLEKEGVVELGQEDKRKNKFKIKRVMTNKGNNRGIFTNPKYREKAAKIIQGWWRNLKNKYDDILAKIIMIQSVFRGRFVRKYLDDFIYLNFLYISFCKKIENALSNHVRLDFTEEIKDIIKNLQESKDIITIRNCKNKLGKIPSIINLYKITIDLLNHNNNKLKFDLEREKKFNKELKLNIKKLEAILSDKEKEIKEEKKQKNDLITKINEIKNISINNNLFEIIEKKEKLEDEIKKLKEIFPFEYTKEDKIFKVTFLSFDENIHYSMICKNTDKFYRLEEEFYDKFPEYKKYENMFLINGQIIHKFNNLESNNIGDNHIIVVKPKNKWKRKK